jgi:hypothetical protein
LLAFTACCVGGTLISRRGEWLKMLNQESHRWKDNIEELRYASYDVDNKGRWFE